MKGFEFKKLYWVEGQIQIGFNTSKLGFPIM